MAHACFQNLCSSFSSLRLAGRTPRRFHSAMRLTMPIAYILVCCQVCYSQSTFGTVLGTVKDPSGSLVPTAKVDLINTGTSATRSTITDASGGYQFVNTEIGNYTLKVQAPGFQITDYKPFDLEAML